MQPAASVTPIVNDAGPASVGVPESRPAAESETPAGSAPAVTANPSGGVAPDAPSDEEYALPTAPSGRNAGDTVIAGQVNVNE